MSGAKPPLVLVPGLQSDIISWLPLIERLAEHTLFVPSGFQRAKSIGEMGSEVMAQAPQKFIAVGWSMGGYVCMDMVRRSPERLAGLILIATTARHEPTQNIANRHAAIERAQSFGLRDYQQENLKGCVYDFTQVPSAHLDKLSLAAERLGLAALKTQTEAIIARADSREMLRNWTRPTLVISGNDDNVMPQGSAAELRDLLPHAHWVDLDHCGHCPPLEHPEQVAQEITNFMHAHFASGVIA